MEQFAQIVHEYSPRLVGLATRIVGSREAAEDVVQDALVKAFRKLKSWRGDGSMSTWLYTIVYREAISAVRRRREFSRELPDIVFENDETGDWQITEANIERMQRALEQLPPTDRTLVTLFYMDDKSVRDCALICALSETNVKVRLHRARARLRELMGGFGPKLSAKVY